MSLSRPLPLSGPCKVRPSGFSILPLKGMIWASGPRLALSQPLFKILGYWGPSTLPTGTTGVGVEDQVLVLNSLEIMKSTCQGVVGLARASPLGPPALLHPETLRFGRKHPTSGRGGEAQLLEFMRPGFEFWLCHLSLPTFLTCKIGEGMLSS